MLWKPAVFLFTLVAIQVPGAVLNVTCVDATQDTATLRNAIAQSHTGDAIHIHEVCLVNQTIVLSGNRTYSGDSRTGTIIRQADGSNLPALLASDSWALDSAATGEPIRIAHLTLDGNSANNARTNALVIRSWLTVIEDLQVENAPGDGIQITNLSKNNVPLQNTQVNGTLSDCFITGSGGNGIHVVDTGNSVTDWNLLDSWVATSGQSAILMDNAAGWRIAGNHLYGVPQHGIFASRCYATAIESNYIEDFGDSGGKGNTWYGIACTVQGGAASVLSANKVFQFNGEPPSGSFVYIGVPQVNYGTGALDVVNNTIFGAGGASDTGLSYQLGAGAGLLVLSRANNVQSAGNPRAVGPGVTLIAGY